MGNSIGMYFMYLRSTHRILVSSLGIALSLHLSAAAAGSKVDLVYIGPDQGGALSGVQQGLDEANLQGRFLGQRYHLKQIAAPDPQTLTKPNAAVFSAQPVEELIALSKRYPALPLFNLTNADDQLRAACLPNVLHILPSARMVADAEAQWLKAHPDSPAQAVAWHPRFEKYSGSQLNARFEKARQQKMDSSAWAGWAAVKMVADSIARSQTHKPGALLKFLRDELTFDGQKGIDMNFRADGQLRQVLLLTAGDKVVGEAPVRGVADPQDLDTLGAATNCMTKRRRAN